MRELRAFLVAWLLLVALAPSARAQPDPARANQARAHFEAGLKSVEEGRFDVALTDFRNSVAAYPTRAAWQNIAFSLKQLERYDEAADAVERTLLDFPNMAKEDRDFLLGVQAELRTRLGFVDVRASESDATITIDGVERGTSPSKPIRVSAGTHLLRVAREGFVPFERRMDVPREQTVLVDARLGALVRGGRLAVVEEQARALDVIVDGARVGTTPWEGTLSLGLHAVHLRGEGALGSAPASASIELNHLTKLTLLAEPVPCRLRVVPTPATAIVAIDGVELGRGSWVGRLRCGGHRIDVTSDGFVARGKEIALTENRDAQELVVLDRDPAYGKQPSRITVSASASLLLAPSFGGEPASSCGASCSSAPGVGTLVLASAGYRLGSGLGLSMTAGYAYLSKSYAGRPIAASVAGNIVNRGTLDEDLRLRGPHLGVSASYRRGEPLQWSARLGAGAIFATWSSQRAATLMTAPTNQLGAAYTVPDLAQHGSFVVPYMAADLRVGFVIASQLTLEAGLTAMGTFGVDRAQWSDETIFRAGQCPSPSASLCQGQAWFPKESLFGGVIVAGGPVVALTREF